MDDISPKAKSFSEVVNEKVTWVVDGWVPVGCLTLLIGDPGTAKSLLSHTWAGELSLEGVPSLLLSAEDSPSFVIGPRLTAMEADKTKIFFPEKRMKFPNDFGYLENLIKKHQPKLLVLDLLDSFSNLSLSSSSNTHKVLGPLISLSQSYNLGVVGLLHLGKQKKSDIHRTLGSIELAGMARSVILVEKDKDDWRTVNHVKCNFAKQHDAVWFCLESVDVGGLEAPLVVYGRKGTKKEVEKCHYTVIYPPTYEEVNTQILRLIIPCVDAHGEECKVGIKLKWAEMLNLVRSLSLSKGGSK